MTEKNKTYRLFISAAEASGDSHCAALITALKASGYNFEFIGVGGEKMGAAGCGLIEVTTAKAAMIYKALGRIFSFFRIIRRIKKFLKAEKIDMVIVCDSPAFNFHVAKTAKKLGIPTFFYVAPQLWAWGQWRLKKLQRCCDRLACILPFEQQWFESRGVNASFVGNPMLDELNPDLSCYKKKYADFEPNNVRLLLCPGSREGEIQTLWEPMQKIALRVKHKYPQAAFTAVAVDDRGKEVLKSMQTLGFRCNYIIGSINEALVESDFAIVASGSATLQIAAAGCPMVIMYQSSRILWHLLGRWLLKTKLLSLINILAGKELVPEFMPHFSSIEPVVESIEQLLENKSGLAQLSSRLVELVEPLGKVNASEKTSQLIIEMLEQKKG